MRRLVPIAVLVLALSGCSGIGHGDAPGTWVSDTGASLEIRTDGSMSYSDVPVEIADFASAVEGDGCVDAIAASTDLRSGDGGWSDEGGFFYLYFEDGAVQAWADGFPAFDQLSIRCDVESGAAYRFDRQ